ncbi:MAG: ferrous iron transport protein B [Euryarchaeota archaeon]|nr:ferrous iron transport protein B [Euryarchaeota archaeon]
MQDVSKNVRVALCGNPNVGKSSLFNALTDSRQHVGNWPGVTVERKSGYRVYRGHRIEIVDLPGTYSLIASSKDEEVATKYIIEESPDVVLQVVDSSNLERNLYLTMQLMEFGKPMVLAMNMSDITEDRGDSLDLDVLKRFLGAPAVRTVASEGIGLEELLDAIVGVAKRIPVDRRVGYGELEATISDLRDMVERDAEISSRYPSRWMATRLIENDSYVKGLLADRPIWKDLEAYLSNIDREEGEMDLADSRYTVIDEVVALSCKRCKPKRSVSDSMDRVLVHRYLGIPIFLILLWGAFELTFSAAAPFMDLIDAGFAELGDWVAGNVRPEWLASLLADGVIGGVGSVLIFLPNIVIMFMILGILEDSGYMARVAFLMDRLMSRVGLQGKSAIPLIMGFGCNLPAIMATRSIEDRKDRLITIMVTPFMSCSARLPVYILFAGAFFSHMAGTIVFMMYMIGIAAAIFTAMALRAFVFKGEPSAFIMELPPYRLPTTRSVGVHTWDRAFLYVKKAGTIILLGVVAIWALASLPFGVEYGSEASWIGAIGKVIEPLVEPLGFDWRIAVALLFGFVAKEIIVGGLMTLYGAGQNENALTDALKADGSLNQVNAFGLMTFSLLYMPCVATAGIIWGETRSWKWTMFSIVYGIVLAYAIALLIWQVGGPLFG